MKSNITKMHGQQHTKTPNIFCGYSLLKWAVASCPILGFVLLVLCL